MSGLILLFSVLGTTCVAAVPASARATSAPARAREYHIGILCDRHIAFALLCVGLGLTIFPLPFVSRHDRPLL